MEKPAAPAAAAPASEPRLPPGYTLHVGTPPVADYRRLRAESGLSALSEEQASRAVVGAWYGCYVAYTAPPPPPASDDEEEEAEQEQQAASPVGMGRIISDGGWYFHIVDVAVLPGHQRRGLGAAIMRELLAHIERERPAEGRPNINLLADPPGVGLYKKLGFVPSGEVNELGMIYVQGASARGRAAAS